MSTYLQKPGTNQLLPGAPKEVADGIDRRQDTHSMRARARKEAMKIPDGSVEPFPVERFAAFLKVLKIQSKDYGLIPLKLLGSQLYVLEEIIAGMKEGITTFVILKNRQAGISTLCLALDLFWAFEHKGLLGIFATHDEGSRDQFRNQIDVFLSTLPKTHRIEYDVNNRLMLVLKNASLFRYLVAGTRTTTNKMGRSGGCNYAHMTEVAFWGSQEDLKAVGQTLSELYRYRLFIYESTANGFNHYYDMWEIAKASPAQKAIFVGWWRDERNEFDASHPLYPKYMPKGKDTPMTQLERERVRTVKKQYGFIITAGQLAWYRFHLETKCASDQSAMDQEMPWTEEDAFVSTGKSFFTNPVLTDAMRQAKRSLCLPFIMRLTDRFEDTRLQACAIDRAELKIWQKPSKFGTYTIGADPIFGTSADQANGVIHVSRCYSDGIEQVAEYAAPTVSTYQFAWVLAFLAGLYKNVTIQLEINGPGVVVLQELGQLRQKLATFSPEQDPDMRNCLLYMKEYLYRRADSLTSGVLRQWKSSEEAREQLLHKFRDGLQSKRMIIRSLMCLDEAKSVQITEDGYICAPSGKRDDRVFGGALAYWCWDEQVRNQLAGAGMTRAKVMEIERNGSHDPIEGLVNRFLKDAKISVRQ